MYRTAGFVYEVLICANYASCRDLVILILQLAQSWVSYSWTFVSAHCKCHSSMLVISFYVSVQILQKRDTYALLPDPKRPKDWDGCVNHVHEDIAFATLVLLQCITLPNILIDVVSSDHRVYSNNDSTSASTSHAIAHDDFMRLRSLVIGYFADIQILLLGREIDALQKLGLADKTHYMVYCYA